MLKNYFKIAYRNLLKNKIFSVVNIFGLAIGMAACFFIFLYVHFELSYDRFNKNAANLYRIPISYSGSFSNLPMTATNHPAVGPAMKADFPEVVDFARAVPLSFFTGTSMISYDDNKGNNKTFNEDKIYLVDPSFLSMFSFPFVTGDPKKALLEGKTIVISGSMAKKYFGNASPMGKTIYLNRDMPLKVTGVFSDVPENSHLKFDMLMSFNVMGEKWGYAEWTWPEFYNYVLLAPGTDPKKLESKFPAFINKYLGAKLKELNFGCQFYLQSITSIHLKSNYLKEPEANGSDREIYFLSIIGIFILVIAWINYINLSTAKSMERAKEVGLRKVVGAGRTQLMEQFIMESALVNLLALFLAFLIVVVCFPFFGQFLGKNINQGFLSSGLLNKPLFWISLVFVFFTGAFLVGAYPAFILSAFKPALVLKGKFFRSNKGTLLRKTLVSFQFILSILLIAGTITVYMQLSFMQNQALGYNKDQVMIIKAPAIYDSTYQDKYSSFRTMLLQNTAVNDIAYSSDIPGKTIWGRNSVRRADEDKTHNFTPFIMQIDEHFISTLQMEMAAGRNFRQLDSSNVNSPGRKKIIINEAVVKALGYKNNEAALNRDIIFNGGGGDIIGEVIGIIKNYHQKSLREIYDPILYYYPGRFRWSYFSVHINANNMAEGLASIEKEYKAIFTGSAFEYFFLNEYFNQQYQADQRFGKVFSLFTILAIFVSCLGLLGLSSFVIKLRTKEIGIRKVLGAPVYSLLVLFSKDFIKLVGLASVIALPVIYFSAGNWLNNYAFHIRLNWIIFLIPPVLLLVIALVTISIQSIKAAFENPIKNLRAE